MKTLTTLVLIATFSFAMSFNSNAQKSLQLRESDEIAKTYEANHRIIVKVNSDNKVILRADLLEGQKKLNYVLRVFSDEGKSVYRWHFLNKKPIYKSYDLSKLPEGKYTFNVVEKGVPLYSKTVSNKSQQITNPDCEELIVEEL